MASKRVFLFALVMIASAGLVSACCGAGCPPRSTQGGPSASSSHAGLPPRMDLHCTPQSTGDESACVSQGKDHHFGPGLTCRGIPVGNDVLAAEHEAYEKGTNPCVCYTDRDIEDCSKVP